MQLFPALKNNKMKGIMGYIYEISALLKGQYDDLDTPRRTIHPH